jgi:glycosyltransferase involved in cell wall biosynthesis
MKILCVIDNLGSGGSQRQLVELALCLKKAKHDVSFLVYHELNFFKYLLDLENIIVCTIKESNYIKRILKIRKSIRHGNYDAILSFLEAPNFICEISAIPSRKWKLVVSERSAKPIILKSLRLISFRWFHLLADSVVTNSYVNLRIIKKVNPLISNSKCSVIYNIVDVNFFKPSTDYSPRINGKINIIVIASHQYLKNLNGLIEALSLLNEAQRNFISIEWYGDKVTEPFLNDSFPKAVQKIKSLKLDSLINFFPATNEINTKIQNADVLGLFSFYEGLPNTVCEGMSCGKPILCSRISDLPSILSHQKELLFNPNDFKSIYSSILYLIQLTDKELEHIGLTNLKIAQKEFNKDIITNKYINLLSRNI